MLYIDSKEGKMHMEEKEKDVEGEREEEELIKNLNIRKVNRKVWEQFKGIVAAKTGKMHGVLGIELEKALKHYIRFEEEEMQGSSVPRRDEHTHTQTHRIRKDMTYEKAYPLTSRERRLKAIGNILFNNNASAIVQGRSAFVMSEKGMERLIISQKISEQRVIKDYIHAMQIKGWIEKEKTHYTIISDAIAEELNLSYPAGYIKKTLEGKHEELLNGGNHLTL